MSRIFWSLNDSAAFRSFFHYYYVVGEAGRLMHPEQQYMMPNYFEAEVLAYDYKEYQHYGFPHMAGDSSVPLPSGS